MAMSKECIYEMQKCDCNCNDCKHLERDFERYQKYNYIHTDKNGKVSHPSHRIQYGSCTQLNKAVSFIPNTCNYFENKNCFEHRKKSWN